MYERSPYIKTNIFAPSMTCIVLNVHNGLKRFLNTVFPLKETFSNFFQKKTETNCVDSSLPPCIPVTYLSLGHITWHLINI